MLYLSKNDLFNEGVSNKEDGITSEKHFLYTRDLSFETHLKEHVFVNSLEDEYGEKVEFMGPIAKSILAKVRANYTLNEEKIYEFPINKILKTHGISAYNTKKVMKLATEELLQVDWIDQVKFFPKNKERKAPSIKITTNELISVRTYVGVVKCPIHYGLDRKVVNSHIMAVTRKSSKLEEVLSDLNVLRDHFNDIDWKRETNGKVDLASHKQRLIREKKSRAHRKKMTNKKKANKETR